MQRGDAIDSGVTDRVLVERTLAGNKEAFAILHKRYYGRVFRHALYRTRSVSDAEDVAAETFLRAIAHLPAYRFQGESIYPWLARIATNLILDQGRRFSGTSIVSLDAQEGDGVRAYIENLTEGGLTAQMLAERHETQTFLRTAIAALPSDQAEAVLLRFGGDMPLKEIAVALNRTEGAIKSLLHRALVNLRRTITLTEQEAEAFGLSRQQYNAPTSSTARTGKTAYNTPERKHHGNS